MNAFEQKLIDSGQYPLKSHPIDSIVLQMGHKCNLRCSHCYVSGSPDAQELTPLATIDGVLDILRKHPEIATFDITGGSPELNPHFYYAIESASTLGKEIVLSSNITMLCEPEMEDLPEFLAHNAVTICASLSCVQKENVDAQRGQGTFQRVIAALQRLNAVGYGNGNSNLELDLIFNPAGAFLAPDKASFESQYRSTLKDSFGITFDKLYVLNNMPLGRMEEALSADALEEYMTILQESFNPDNLHLLMCRSSVTFGPADRKCYDCDFGRTQNYSTDGGKWTIDNFDYEQLSSREIQTSPLCFGCTAGSGLECCAEKL